MHIYFKLDHGRCHCLMTQSGCSALLPFRYHPLLKVPISQPSMHAPPTTLHSYCCMKLTVIHVRYISSLGHLGENKPLSCEMTLVR